jgi:hypothetical protein
MILLPLGGLKLVLILRSQRRSPDCDLARRPRLMRERTFSVSKRVGSYLVLYRWPNAGETVDLTQAGQGQFSTISNSLRFKLSDETIFNGNCKPKNN